LSLTSCGGGLRRRRSRRLRRNRLRRLGFQYGCQDRSLHPASHLLEAGDVTLARIGHLQIERLADDVRAKILANAELIAKAKGKITVSAYRRPCEAFEIELTVTT
jgi:hypothetical protein